MKRQTGFRLTEEAYKWIDEKAKKDGISKNDVVQLLVNKAMESEATRS